MRRRFMPLILIVLIAAGGLAAALLTGSSPRLGLDLQGGISVVLEPTTDVSEEQLDQAVAIIRERVDSLGVAEPEITRQGSAVVVQLPGVDDRERVLELVGSTAELRFRPVLSVAPADAAEVDQQDGQAEEGEAQNGEAQNGEQDEEAQEDQSPQLTPQGEDDPDAEVVLEGKDGELVYTLGPMLTTGEIVSQAQATLQTGQWLVALEFHAGEEGVDQFNQAAALCFQGSAQCPPQQGGRGQLAIVLDSVVQSAPAINAPSYERDQAVIEGDFTEGEAKDLARLLRYGSLPVEFERQSVETVSATLGEDSLRAGVIAGLVGLALVSVYMIAYYRVLGTVVIFGMTLWGALMYAVIAWFGATQGLALTLAGVTGIIISVGVTVDSYVVYYERLKDEVKLGRTLRTSADRAFKQAFRTILAANTSTFIGAAVLWRMTVGSVRGFAFFLGLATVLGVLVTATFTRSAVSLLARSRLLNGRRGIGVARPATGSGPAAAASAEGTS